MAGFSTPGPVQSLLSRYLPALVAEILVLPLHSKKVAGSMGLPRSVLVTQSMSWTRVLRSSGASSFRHIHHGELSAAEFAGRSSFPSIFAMT